MIDNKKVGLAIAQLRQSKNLTQQQLAACLNVSHQAVSKWENGAALPDVLKLMELSRMFGVTLEQLLNGDVAHVLETEDDPHENPDENTDEAPNEDPREEPIVLKLDTEDILSKRRMAEAAEAEANGDAGEAEAVADEEAQAEKTEAKASKNEPLDVEKIIQMAPFMSRAALEEMIRGYSGSFSPRDLARLAPFVSAEFLESLIESGSEINWDTLRRLAPFLKKEAVDALTMAVAKGEKYCRPAAKAVKKTYNELGKSISKAMKKLGNLGDQICPEAARTARPAAAKPEPAPKPEKKNSDLRTRIFERALAEDKFDWIAEHLEQLEDEELKERIARKALEKGMTDWVSDNLGEEYNNTPVEDLLLQGNWEAIEQRLERMDDEELALTAETAASEGKWDWIELYLDDLANSDEVREALLNAAVKAGKLDWIGNHLDELEPESEVAEMLVKAALEKGDWDWLESHHDEMELDDMDVGELALKAYQAGRQNLCLELAEEYLEGSGGGKLFAAVVENGDTGFAEELAEHLDGDSLKETCLKLAQDGHLGTLTCLAEALDADTLTALLDLATEEGDWDTIERLNEALEEKQ